MNEFVQIFISQLLREGREACVNLQIESPTGEQGVLEPVPPLRYLVLTMRTQSFDSTILEDHYAFLNRLRRQGILELGGPFADRSGGAYVLRVDSLERAKAIAFTDPLHLAHASTVTVRPWQMTYEMAAPIAHHIAKQGD